MLNLAAGPVPPDVPQQFTADDSTVAVPVANNLNLLSRDTTANNDNGIRTTASGDDFFIELTNRATGQTNTTDAMLTNIITFDLGTTPAVYSMTGYVTAIVKSGINMGAGGSYFFDASFKTTGAAASEIGTEYPTTFEDVSLATADIFVVASLNNVIVQVQGITESVDWDAILEFRKVT